MADTPEQSAADLIWEMWQRGEMTGELPADLAPQSRTDGYAIQAKLRPPDHPLAGWKIAATSAAGQSHLAIDGPIAGRIFADRVRKPGDTISISKNRMRVCEPEFAFRFGQDIEPRNSAYSVDEVMAGVCDLHLTLELPDSRFAECAKVGASALIADNACADWLVVGPAVAADWRTMDLSRHAVTGYVAGRTERDGTGANVLGDPRIALTWLVNELSALGITVAKSHLVTTGTSMVPLEVVEGDDVMADFGALGQVQVFIAA
jgi:2-keto-4-pentenoate hydratase